MSKIWWYLPLAVLVSGCTSSAPVATSAAPSAEGTAAPATPAAGPTHEHHPPHHGTLVELGEEFAHIELVEDSATSSLNAYVLDGEAENPVRLTQKSIDLEIHPPTGASYRLQLKPQADALTGEKVGDTSEFSAPAVDLVRQKVFTGSVDQVVVKGTTFKNVTFSFPGGNEPKKP